ncbi:MAG: ATPase [Isosphaeraceae bacterium]|jgi:Ca2+-transporting ATPase|nr:MAG: ATPase [Isosphaeraceae bacterium]
MNRPALSGASAQADDPLWHALDPDDGLARLGSRRAGLTTQEARERLARFGLNQLETTPPVSAWAILLAQFRNTLILILIAAVVISALLGHALEAVAISAIVLLATLLGFVQEYHAERSLEKLRQMAAPLAHVLRDGVEVEIPAAEVVPGDLILLRAGNRVPADARLLEAFNLRAEESGLTGESTPVEKNAQARAAPDAPLGDRPSMVYAGTAIVAGRGLAVVTATGMRTEFGKVARLLRETEPGATPLQQNLDRVGRALARGAGLIVLLIVTAGLLRGQDFVDMLIFGVALAVAVVPEALPAVVTISLAIGVQRMVRRNALIRRLPAVETLGSTSVIGTDKTGTLTRNEMTVRKLYAAGATYELDGVGYEPRGRLCRDGVPVEPTPEPVRLLLEAAILASDSRLEHDPQSGRWRILGDPTEGALVVAAAKLGLDKAELDARRPRVHEIPFSAESKRMTTVHADAEGWTAAMKGAPEAVITACTSLMTNHGVIPLDEPRRQEILQIAAEQANQALRVLAVASRRLDSLDTPERDLTFLGLVGMIDPPRPEARDAIRRCRDAGIRVLMITGDHPATAHAIARELDLLQTGRVVTGPTLETMTDAELLAQVESIDVYARVSPEHKLRIVDALQRRGHVVAMTGDGINDAPALKRAAIGVAMGITGTDVTKEAAAMTLLDDNFASIVAAVEEGRAIYGNIKKYLMYLLSSNIGEIALMAAAALLGLPMPLAAVPLLYVNLATDGLPALALAVDPPEPDLMRHPPRNPQSGLFTRPVVVLMIVGGLWSALVNLGLFAGVLLSGQGLARAMTLTFVCLVLIQFFKAYNLRSDHRSVLVRPFANRWLNLAILWELLLMGAVVSLPVFHGPFRIVPLEVSDWLLAGGLAATVSPVLELVKWMVRRGWFGPLD